MGCPKCHDKGYWYYHPASGPVEKNICMCQAPASFIRELEYIDDLINFLPDDEMANKWDGLPIVDSPRVIRINELLWLLRDCLVYIDPQSRVAIAENTILIRRANKLGIPFGEIR